MRINFHAHYALGVRFLTGELMDFPFQLVGLLTIEPAGFAASLGLDHPQAFKEQHTARILLTHLDNGTGGFVSSIGILAANMPPEVLIAALAFDRIA